MHQTASSGLLTYIAQLIQVGYQVDERDLENRTPLYYASRNGQREICTLLPKHGAYVGAEVNNGKLALHIAAFGRHEGVVRLLLEDYETDVEAKDKNGQTVPHWAAVGGSEAVVRLLLGDYKADVEAKGNDGRTVLHWAAGSGSEAVVLLLLEDSRVQNHIRERREQRVEWAKVVCPIIGEAFGRKNCSKGPQPSQMRCRLRFPATTEA
jgi:ankyrin repeat protein